MKRLLPLVPLLVVACTARWNSVVRYSPAPMPPGSTDRTVYDAVVADMKGEWRLSQVAIQRTLDDTTLARVRASWRSPDTAWHRPRFEAPHQWESSLKRQVEAAGLSEQGRPANPGPDDLAAFLAAGVAANECHTYACPLPRVSLDLPGYNADSTIALVHVEITCGEVCGRGEWVVLARRPAHAWQIWWREVDWVS